MTDQLTGTTHRPGYGGEERLHPEVQRLRKALEDILALAHSAGEPTTRATAMQRRAIAALSGRDAEPAPVPGRDHRTDARDTEGFG